MDTWAWLVLADDGHSAHEAVFNLRQESAQSGSAWVTTDYVLNEVITRIFPRVRFSIAEKFCRGIFQAAEAGSVRIEPVTPERFDEAFRLRLRYRDKPRISFTDLTSFVVMKELAMQRVLTEDAHFVQVGLGFERVP